jgi:hypothetical protein
MEPEKERASSEEVEEEPSEGSASKSWLAASMAREEQRWRRWEGRCRGGMTGSGV